VASYLRSAAEKAAGRVPAWPRFVHEQPETIAAKLRMLVFGGWLETDVRRAVVIDAEGCTFDLLESFANAKRVLITPLKPSRVPTLELTYTRGSYYRPYREHDELRIAQATLVHKSSGRSLTVGALLVLAIRGDDEIARRNIYHVALWTTANQGGHGAVREFTEALCGLCVKT